MQQILFQIKFIGLSYNSTKYGHCQDFQASCTSGLCEFWKDETHGGQYVNLDLFSEEGVCHAAYVQLLFPKEPYLVVYESDYASAEVNGRATIDATVRSGLVEFVISPFLPEVAMGLFSLPPGCAINDTTTLPKARIHAIFPPASMRISLYYQYYTSAYHSPPPSSNGSYLQFVTSSSIVVNNYITRILSGQCEEGSPVTTVHLEVARISFRERFTCGRTAE